MTKYLYGLHEGHENEGYLIAENSGKSMWLVSTHELGHDPENMSSFDYSFWANRGHTFLARLNNGYFPNGTIPTVDQYAAFATRVQNWVRNSQGCNHWIIGNEMNHEIERPEGYMIYPDSYALCYEMCRDMIKAVPGHENDQVILGAVAPYNNQTTYEGNERGDWVQYLADILTELGTDPDGIALHAYTHGADPNLIYSEQRMNEPFTDRFYHFYTFVDFAQVIPTAVPVYITETNQGEEPWENVNSGWVKNAYAAIDEWNEVIGNPTIRCLTLYRWPEHDLWSIVDKANVQKDFADSMLPGYTWGKESDMGWVERYRNSLEGEWYDQDNESEVTLPLTPVKHYVTWDTDWGPRPEMDFKDKEQGEPEVYDLRFAGVGFHVHTRFSWTIHTDLIPIAAGQRTYGTVAVMVDTRGVDGDQDKLGDCGMRLGISEQESPDSDQIIWSPWWSVRDDPNNPELAENQRVWGILQTPEFVPAVGQARLFIQCNANIAAALSAGHYDLETIMQYDEGGTIPPPTGEDHVVQVLLDGEEVCRFTVPSSTDPDAVALVTSARDDLNEALEKCGAE